MKKGLYLYCILSGSAKETFNLDNLRFVSVKDIQALVEEVPLEEFWGENLKKNLEDLKWIETKVLKHNHVVGKAAQKWTTIPMKFGTVFESEESLQKVLNEKEDEFKNLLLELEGKEEWGIKVFFDVEMFKDFILNENEELKKMKSEVESKSLGLAYFYKKKMEKYINEITENTINDYVTEIHNKISKEVLHSCLNKLQGKEMTKRQEEMVLNSAYLVEKEKIDSFSQKVSDLQKSFSDKGFKIELSGPWPAYSFVSLEQSQSEGSRGL